MSNSEGRAIGAVRFSSLLVITHNRALIRLRCPFRVVVIHNFDGALALQSIREVQYIQFLPDIPYYRIHEGLYPCTGFAILI